MSKAAIKHSAEFWRGESQLRRWFGSATLAYFQLVLLPLCSFSLAMESSIHEQQVEIGVESRVLHLREESLGRARAGMEENDSVLARVQILGHYFAVLDARVGDVVEVQVAAQWNIDISIRHFRESESWDKGGVTSAIPFHLGARADLQASECGAKL